MKRKHSPLAIEALHFTGLSFEQSLLDHYVRRAMETIVDLIVRSAMELFDPAEPDHEHLLETLEARSRDGLRLDADTPLDLALVEWKRDVRWDAHRTQSGRWVSQYELLEMHRRAVAWFWFWSLRWPHAAQRPRFAKMAAEREAAMETILAGGRN